MIDLMIFAFMSGFLVSVAPGLVNLIAFEQVLSASFRSGWAVALGGTAGQAIFVTAVITLYVFYGDSPYVQSIIAQIEGVIDWLRSYKNIAAIAAGVLIILAGFYYLRKQGKEEENTGTGFVVGMVLTLFSLDYMATYATIYGVKTDGLITPPEAFVIVLATIVGIHTCWFGKIALVQVLKHALIKYNWTDFNRITSWFLLAAGLGFLLWGLFTV